MRKYALILLLTAQLCISQNKTELNYYSPADATYNSSIPASKEFLNYYLPADVTYNSAIPTPKEIIGHEVGEWHVTHDKLLFYMSKLAEISPRITLENRGTTYEGRPLILLTITSPENHSRLEEIRTNHLKLTEENSSTVNTANMPVVVYQGFSIHGNEASGANAALAVAYYLAAAEGPGIEQLLNDEVILFDPSFNPDGLQRFSTWVNSHKSNILNPDNNDREYNEVWPGGRTNHYWFDLNRDWLPAQLPESRARIVSFHKWMPNIVTDHHEMGTNSTFFFQPGEPSRVNPLTPVLNQELTKEIAQFHAAALDKIGSLYYSEQDYDDYYYGKGSTFPDINGSIGILFEQASSRGHLQNSDNGIITFPFTIKNQFTTALSTLNAALRMRTKILDYQRDFYKAARTEASKVRSKAWVFGDEKDASKTFHLADILRQQDIKIYNIDQDFDHNGKHYKKGYAYMVPQNQKNSRMIEAMFEERISFQDSLFYDISAWTFPHAFNLDYAELNSLSHMGNEIATPHLPEGNITSKSNYAYVFEWHEYYTPKALYKILQKGIRAKVGMKRFSMEGNEYDYGSIMIPVQNQELNEQELFNFLEEVAMESHITINGVNTGLTTGIDLGSNDFKNISLPKVGLLTGNGITYADAGEIWHVFDQRYHIPITKLDTEYFNRTNLSDYTVIILPNSRNALNEAAKTKLQKWVSDGGTLIGFKNAVNYLSENDFIKVNLRKSEKEHIAKNISFEQKENFQGAQVTAGAIFEANIDRSHPVNFGYKNDKLSLFRINNIYLEPSKNSYDNPIQYTMNPLLSGYISEENNELIKGSVPFKVAGKGRGQVILFTDNTNFRAFWFGTNKLMMNCVFFGDMM